MNDGCGLGGGGGVHDHIKTFYYHTTCIVEYSYTSVIQSKTRGHEELDMERPNFHNGWKGEGIQQNTSRQKHFLSLSKNNLCATSLNF